MKRQVILHVRRDKRTDKGDCDGSFANTARMEPEQILVVGCSSSEIASFRIGSHSSGEIGQAVFEVIYGEIRARGIDLAAQCCEHLNRALIVEEERTALRP